MNIIYTTGAAGIVTVGTYSTISDPSLTSLDTTPNIEIDTLTVTGVSTLGLSTVATAPSNETISFELSSDTNLRIRVRGSDGTLRTADITLS